MKINKADKWFSIFIRLRDANDEGFCKCITCGRIKHWRLLDCGHHIKRQHQGTRYHEKNCAAQCKGCNNFGQGEDAKFKEAIIKKYGQQQYDLLEACKRTICKRSQLERDLLAEEYEKKARALAAEKGIEI
jgi:hypothetical protein